MATTRRVSPKLRRPYRVPHNPKDHEPAVTRSPVRPVLIALACAAMAVTLGGCGRKGFLELPPQAQAQGAPAAAPTATAEEQANLGPGSIIDQSLREQEPPQTPRSKRKFILDPLLGN
jgi:predicted small lipoprotein YifL